MNKLTKFVKKNCQMKSKYFMFLLWILQIGLYVKSLKIEFV